MYRFGSKSKERLSTCDPRLIELCEKVLALQVMDFTVITGYRGEAEQDDKFAKGLSKVKFPNGKHNIFLSKAVDLAPYPIDWSHKLRFGMLAGLMHAVASTIGVTLRWGGNFDGNWDTKHDEWDPGHFEIVETI